MFGASQEKAHGAFEEAPQHWSPQKKRNFHNDRVKQLTTTYDKYKNMFRDADAKGDSKRAAYAKKHASTLYYSLRAHKEAFMKLRPR